MLITATAALTAAAACGEPASPPSGARTGTPPTAADGAPAASGPPAVRIAVTVTGGKARTAQRRVKVPRGAAVEITVTGDTADEFHLHGYDRELRLRPGRAATLRFTADTPGVFEAELHHSGARVLELQVG
ncbi:hypothetical protein BKA00_001962 [Actinomadura coerulea]|uniref:EfeO-type cupredoxin-like domain-containing protein n=1 Tax=Actinomadura coerulea TaxID=46159 RepID=A0A7X0FWK7_9ACTN|nr:hypothetical protein [Actinomadura coerulea]MBB6395048.1 hypothetical protein [Actinomadura coerulea]GGQ14412.1 hypothetical protein GCM10010187_33370 [Actinomadura coerulea]